MFTLTNSVCNLLMIQFLGKCVLDNGQTKNLVSTFYYIWDGAGSPPGVGQKVGLVTNASTGFKAKVVVPLLAALNARWVSNGIQCRWLDQYQDQFVVADALTTAGAITSDSLPLEDCVTIRKNTGIRGRHYRGSWHFAPASESDTTKDRLTTAGISTWVTGLRPGLMSNISDGTSTFAPCLVSQSLCTLKDNPNPLIIKGAKLAGTQLVNLALGEMSRRIEKPRATA